MSVELVSLSGEPIKLLSWWRGIILWLNRTLVYMFLLGSHTVRWSSVCAESVSAFWMITQIRVLLLKTSASNTASLISTKPNSLQTASAPILTCVSSALHNCTVVFRFKVLRREKGRSGRRHEGCSSAEMSKEIMNMTLLTLGHRLSVNTYLKSIQNLKMWERLFASSENHLIKACVTCTIYGPWRHNIQPLKGLYT